MLIGPFYILGTTFTLIFCCYTLNELLATKVLEKEKALQVLYSTVQKLFFTLYLNTQIILQYLKCMGRIGMLWQVAIEELQCRLLEFWSKIIPFTNVNYSPLRNSSWCDYTVIKPYAYYLYTFLYVCCTIKKGLLFKSYIEIKVQIQQKQL